MYVLFFSVIIIILVIVYQNIHIRENLLIYDVNIDDTNININYDENNIAINTIKQSANIPFITFNKKSKYNFILTDPLSMIDNQKMLCVVPDEKAFLIIKKVGNNKVKTISYKTSAERKLFEIISECSDLKNIDLINDPLKADAFIYFKPLNKDQFDFSIDFVTYDNLDVNKLKFYLPYCKIKTEFLDFPTYQGKYPVKTFIALDIILAGLSDIDKFPNYKPNTVPETNFLKIYVPSFEIEQYENITINATHNVDGFLRDNVFYLKKDTINDIILSKGILVTLKNQDKDFENGKYIVADKFTMIKKAEDLTDDGMTGYECIDNVKLKKEECKTVWDKRCISHKECPFFQANKNYPNYFGGCIDGYCQMPIGIKRIGYRKYDKNSKPLCYDNSCDLKYSLRPDYAFPLDSFSRISNL